MDRLATRLVETEQNVTQRGTRVCAAREVDVIHGPESCIATRLGLSLGLGLPNMSHDSDKFEVLPTTKALTCTGAGAGAGVRASATCR